MIKTADAIASGRSLLGTPYSTYDCINYIKKIIRMSPGGKSNYQTAGTNALWRSNDLKNKRKGIADAKPGEVVFKWRENDTPKYPDGLGDFHHIGLVTDRRTVLHSSSVENWNGYRYIDGVRRKDSGYYPGGIGAIETDLDSKWAYTATHKLIAADDSGGGEIIVDVLYKAEVVTKSGSLNMRETPGGPIMGKIPKGTIVNVLNVDDPEWHQVEYNGSIGYCSSQYLQRIDEPIPDPGPEPSPEPDPGHDGSWGVFVPCNSKAAADSLARYFEVAVVCQREVCD